MIPTADVIKEMQRKIDAAEIRALDSESKLDEGQNDLKASAKMLNEQAFKIEGLESRLDQSEQGQIDCGMRVAELESRLDTMTDDRDQTVVGFEILKTAHDALAFRLHSVLEILNYWFPDETKIPEGHTTTWWKHTEILNASAVEGQCQHDWMPWRNTITNEHGETCKICGEERAVEGQEPSGCPICEGGDGGVHPDCEPGL